MCTLSERSGDVSTMKIDKELIEKVSKLAKLNLDESEKEKYIKDFKEILNYFAILDKIDVTSVKSSFRPIEEKNILREDKVQKSITQKEALKFTAHKENGFFIGPKTIG